MLLIVEKGIRGGIYHQFIDTQKLITNIRKNVMRIKNHHILNIGM